MAVSADVGRSHPHLLVVDDDDEVVALIRRYFAGQGFTVSSAEDGVGAQDIVARETVDVILLDLGLPREDGFEVCRQLRAHWSGAIIMVTGRGDAVDRVVGLELGADDYVTKPFDLRELLARVRSVLRRMSVARPAARPVSNSRALRFAGFVLDMETRSLSREPGGEIRLTSGEFDLLCVLAQHANRVLSRDQIMGYLHGRDAGPYDRAVDVQIGRLRKKLEDDPQEPRLIKSIRGAGYLFATSVSAG
ncbi:MAG TPA: response regulator [Dyella sp.]|uniref:response regulator n=1 Tax=Dyella sp. TaxID=1869338 RepID=UPI002F938272